MPQMAPKPEVAHSGLGEVPFSHVLIFFPSNTVFYLIRKAIAFNAKAATN